MLKERLLFLSQAASMRAFKTLVAKNDKYNTGEDKLEHFKEESEHPLALDKQLSLALTYANKHWRKLHSMSKTPRAISLEEWTESLDDLVNYMHLIECLLIESQEVTKWLEIESTNQD